MKRLPILLALLAVLTSLVVLALVPYEAKAQAPEIQSNLDLLPEPVRKMRAAILEAARSGEIEAMRPVLEMNERQPTVSFGGSDDPIAFWKQESGDGTGREILSIFVEILRMPFVRIDAGSPGGMYIWPYLAQLPPKDLTPAQKADLLKLVTPEQAKTMEEFGDYIYYRLGIGADGTWRFFVAGD